MVSSFTPGKPPYPEGDPAGLPKVGGEIAPELAAEARAVRALARVTRALEKVSCPLNLAHYRVLCAVEAGDERASRVAERLAMGKPAVSSAVDALCQRGWLVRAGVGDDLRVTALTVTAAGREALGLAEAAMAAWLSEVCGHTADPAGTLHALARLDAALDKMSQERHRTLAR